MPVLAVTAISLLRDSRAAPGNRVRHGAANPEPLRKAGSQASRTHTSLCVVPCSVGAGLALSIGLALLFVVYESAYPHTAVLGNLPHTDVYRCCCDVSNGRGRKFPPSVRP